MPGRQPKFFHPFAVVQTHHQCGRGVPVVERTRQKNCPGFGRDEFKTHPARGRWCFDWLRSRGGHDGLSGWQRRRLVNSPARGRQTLDFWRGHARRPCHLTGGRFGVRSRAFGRMMVRLNSLVGRAWREFCLWQFHKIILSRSHLTFSIALRPMTIGLRNDSGDRRQGGGDGESR